VAYFEVLFGNIPGGTNKHHENPHPEYSDSEIRYEPVTSRIRNGSVAYSSVTFIGIL
jgi:hypothetical protein